MNVKTIAVLALAAGLFAGRAPAVLTHMVAALDTRAMIVAEALPPDCPVEVTVDDESHLKLILSGDVTGPLNLPTDLGAVTLDLNGWTIRGTNGVDGTATTAGGNGGAAIVVDGESGSASGATAITVVDESDLAPVQLWENGPYFATCNVGASKPEESGYYFWWGDTVGYKRNEAGDGWVSVADGSAIQFSQGNSKANKTFEKTHQDLETAGFTDDESTGVLNAAHDAATAHLGAPWRMMTKSELDALVSNCTTEWTYNWNNTGVSGRIVRGKGDYASKSVFFPSTGYGLGANLETDSNGHYWTSTAYTDTFSAWHVNLHMENFYADYGDRRYLGLPIRAVRESADHRPDPGSAAAIVGGDGGAGNPAGKGAFAVADAAGNEVAVTDALGLATKGADGETLKTPAQEKLEEIFDAANTDTTVKPTYDEDGVFSGHKVILGRDYGSLTLPTDLGAVTIDLNGWTIRGSDGADGSIAKPGRNGSAAIVVAGTSGAAAGATAIAVINESDLAPVQLWEGGPYFAKTNVGAKMPEQLGYYFWWGDTVGYTHDGSKWVSVADGSEIQFTDGNSKANKTYNHDNDWLESNDWIGDDGNLLPEHDAATAHLGAPWRMMTQMELNKLVSTEYCQRTRVTEYKGKEVCGYVVKGKAGTAYENNEVFFPDSGYGYSNQVKSPTLGFYWASTPSEGLTYSYYLSFYSSGSFFASAYSRYDGLLVRPVRESAAPPPGQIIGGDGGDGNPAGKGAFAVADAEGNEVVVTGAAGLVTNGTDGESLKTPVQEKIEEIFDAANTGTTVEPVYDGTGTLAGHKVILGKDYDSLTLSNDLGAVTIDLNGWSITGANGADGTGTTAGENGGAAIVIGGGSGLAAGATTIKVVDESTLPGVQLWENGPFFAERNVGATQPEEPGYFFWWGDTVGYVRNSAGNGWVSSVDGTTTISFTASDAKAKQSSNRNPAELKAAGFSDDALTGVLNAAHDAATVHLGAPWRMMTKDEVDKLVSQDYCQRTWVTSYNGKSVKGYVVKGKAGTAYENNEVFLPAAGLAAGTTLLPGYASYCTATPDSSTSLDCNLYFYSSSFSASTDTRSNGQSVRPVRGTSAGRIRPAAGSAAAITGGDGGDGNPAGKGAFPVVDAAGNEVAVADAAGLVAKGADGALLKSPSQTKLEEIFDTAHTPTTVEPQYDEDGNLAGHEVILGADYDSLALSNDLGAVTLNLNGWTIKGADGADGTTTTAGGNGGAAIVVAGASGAAAGNTVITVTDASASLDGVQLWENGPFFATCNVGAASPDKPGYYFWWGDTVGYVHVGSKWVSVADGSEIMFDGDDPTAGQTFGLYNDDLKAAGFTDDESTGVLNAAHDAATAHLGEPWRMMTEEELYELNGKCTREWTDDWEGTGTPGYVFKGKDAYAEKSVFFPVTGYGDYTGLYFADSTGYYMSSTPVDDDGDYSMLLYIEDGTFYVYDDNRYYGFTVRAIRGPAVAGQIIGGDGGDGNPAGKGAFAVVDADGNEVAVTDAVGLAQNGADGETLKSPAQEKLEEIFDTANSPTTLESLYDEDGNFAGYKLILGRDYGPVAFSNDFGKVTIDFNGWTIRGADGANGTTTTAGGNGGAAITVDGESGSELGPTAITVVNELPLPCVRLWENGPYFATCNVGATKPQEYGYYFWWGDTVGYKRNGSQWVSVADGTTTTEFSEVDPISGQTCGKDFATLKTLGFIDDEANPVLNAAHDAATVYLGAPWRMMTETEVGKLTDENVCEREFRELTVDGEGTGEWGWVVKGKGDYASNSVFFPLAGSGSDSDYNSWGGIWTSKPTDWYISNFAGALTLSSIQFYSDAGTRYYGFSIRAVRDSVDVRPAAGPAAALIGGRGGDGNPEGKGAFAVADAAGNEVAVTDAAGLVKKGADGDFLKALGTLEEIFDTANTPTIVERQHDAAGNLIGHTVILGKDYDTLALSNDLGVVMIDLNGWTIRGTNGVDGTKQTAGGNGGAAIVVDGTSGAEMGPTAIAVSNGSDLAPVQLWENGPYFAKRNVGASSPEENGCYFWWGDTVGYRYDGSKWVSIADGSEINFYYNDPTAGQTYGKDNDTLKLEGWIGEDGNLNAAHDAATVNLGAPWRMMTKAELEMLADESDESVCEWTWMDDWEGTGKEGYVVRGKGAYAANSVFFPAAGEGFCDFLDLSGSHGLYLSSNPMDSSIGSAAGIVFSSDYFYSGFVDRYLGLSVRPVCDFIGARPAAGPAAALIGGDGGNGNPVGKGGAPVVDADGNAVAVTDAEGVLARNGADGDLLKAPAQEKLEEVFDAESTGTAVEPTYGEDGNLAGHKVTLGDDYEGQLNLPTDLGDITIDLNGKTIKGPDGADGTTTTAGGNGGAAIVVADESGAGAGPTAITVVDESDLSPVQLWENGPYFAKTNVGATQPQEYGYYFWWGDTAGYTQNVAQTGWVSVADGSEIMFNMDDPTAGQTCGRDFDALKSLGYIDDAANPVLNAAHDAATANLGAPWRMMTQAELEKLTDESDESVCEWEWTDDWKGTGKAGYVVRGKGAYASNRVFFPAAGVGYYNEIYDLESDYYWSSAPNAEVDYDDVPNACAWMLYGGWMITYDRYFGCPVRPVRESAAPVIGQIVGGDGGDGNSAGKGAPAIADADGNPVAVTAAEGLVTNGVDGAFLKAPSQTKLEEIFDTTNTTTTVEPVYGDDGNLAGHKVILGKDYETLAISNDLGAITLDLNGWTIRGTNGVNGTNQTAGGNGGAAITVDGTSGASAGTTAITVTDASASPGQIIGGDGGNGNPAGKGAFAVADADGNEVAVTDAAGLIQNGTDGVLLKAPAQEALEEIFDTENTGTTVKPTYDEDGNLTGHEVTLGDDYEGPLNIPTDLGDITIDLNGKTIKGQDGDDGTWEEDGADGGAAIVVDGESGAGAGTTTITVKDESEPSGQIAGGDGGDGKTGGKGAPAIVDADGNPYENVTDEDGLLKDGDDGRAYGDPELPWEIGPEGADSPIAYTNGNGQVFVEGSGEPQPDVTPWDPETPDIVVPPGSGDTYREKWPEFADRIVEADYLRLTATGGDVTVGMAGGAEALILEWTLDPTNGPWTVFEAGASNATIAAGATACFRRHELEPQAAANGWGFTFTGAGTVAAAGNALAVLDRTTLAKSVGESALAGLFSGCAKLTAAPALPAKTLGANCYREMFKGCTALAETPALPAPELAAGCYAGMFEGCSNLSKARVVFTNWVDGATADWLKDVRETGDFICVPQLALPASRGGSTIPPGWTPYGPQVRLVEVRPVLRQLGCFTVKYELSGLYPPDAYRLVQKYTVRGQDRSVTTELGHPADGVYTVTNDVRTLYGELVVDPAAHLKVSLFGKGEE